MCNRPEMTLGSLTITDSTSQALRYSQWIIDSNVTGDVVFEMDGNGVCRDADIIMSKIGGDLTFSDSSATGIGFYQTPMRLPTASAATFSLDYSIGSGQVYRLSGSFV